MRRAWTRTSCAPSAASAWPTWGRNAHVNTIPHNASRSDYLKATALECLLGYLYLRGERERISQLFAVMMEEGEYAT